MFCSVAYLWVHIMNNFCSFLLLSVILFQYGADATMTVQVEPKTSDCFYVEATAGQFLRIKFIVVRGGLLDIDLRVFDPNGALIYSGLQFESSEYQFLAQNGGSYQICWNNEMSRWTAKVVQFDILVDTEALSKDGAIVPNSMEASVKKIGEALSRVQADQNYLRFREQAHRDTAESTNARILWYSIIESIVLLSISIGQVYYLRKFFEVKRTV